MGNFDKLKNIEQRVSLYFDDALSTDDQMQLFKSIDNDPQCSKMFEKEKQAREFLKSNFKKLGVTNDFIDSIRKKINIEQ